MNDDLRPRNIGEIFDRAIRLAIASPGSIACVGIVTFFLPRVLCAFALEHLSKGANARPVWYAVSYARPCLDIIYAAALMRLFADPGRLKSGTLRKFMFETVRDALISAPVFAALGGTCLIPFPHWFFQLLLQSGFIANVPIAAAPLGLIVHVVAFSVPAESVMTIAIFALATLAFVIAEAPTAVARTERDGSIDRIEPHEMIVPHVAIVLGAALRAMVRRTLENGRLARTLKVAAALAGVDFFYGLIYNGIAVFFPLYGHVCPTVLSSALLVPGYAFVAAVGYAYNEDARTRLDGLDIARAIARMQAVPVDAGSPAL